MKNRKKHEAWTTATDMNITQEQAKAYYVQKVVKIIAI